MRTLQSLTDRTVIYVHSGPPPTGQAHHHEHTAPHGGTLVALGEEFGHLELLLNKETGELTAYVLDGEAEKPVRLGAPPPGTEDRR